MSERTFVVFACPECGKQVAVEDLERCLGQVWECGHGQELREDGTFDESDPVRIEVRVPGVPAPGEEGEDGE